MSRTFTFNKPTAALLLLPMLLLLALSSISLFVEFSWARLLATVLTGLILFGFFWMTMLRRLTLGSEGAVWRTPSVRHSMSYGEIKGWGKVRYRNFQFIFFTRLEGNPFQEQNVGSTADTFVLQFRPAAWEILQNQMAKTHPDLAPMELVKQ